MKKPKLSRKRCSPLPDIYTLIDKTSFKDELCALSHQVIENLGRCPLATIMDYELL